MRKVLDSAYMDPFAVRDIVTVEVLDPVNGTSLRWTGASTIATRSIPLGRPPWHVTFPSSIVDSVIQDVDKRNSPGGTTTEDLGRKTVAGVVTVGTRTTDVRSIGKLVREVWFSDDLKIAVTDTFTKPRGQQNTIEIRDITLAEPDPSLFEPPQGYTVKDEAPFQFPGGGVLDGIRLPPPPPPPPHQPPPGVAPTQ
jgi:hypothetical protein